MSDPEKGSRGQREPLKIDGNSSSLGFCGWILVIFSFVLVVATAPISIWLCIKIVKEYERAIIFRLGRILKGGAKGPGLFFVLPCTDNIIKVDMRTISFDIPPQEVVTEYEEPVIMRFGHIRKNVSRGAGVYFILPCTDTLTKVDMRTKALELPFQEIFTKDPLVIDVDGVVYYRVQDAFLAVTKVSDADAATNLLAKAIMKNTLGTQTLSHLISDREKIAREIQVLLDNVTADWGVTIEHVEIKNVKTRVNVVSPGNVTPQPRLAKEAAIFLQDFPVSIQLRCLKADGAHPSPHTSTIIFT